MRIKALIFSGGLMPSSLGVMLSTWSVFSHVAIELTDGRILDATLTGGVSIHKPVKAAWRWGRRVDLADILSNEELDAAMATIAAQIGKPYDVGWAVGYLLNNRKWNDAGKWVCSELIWLGFPDLQGKEQYRVTPKNVWHSLQRLINKN